MKVLIINYDFEICTSRTSLCDGDKILYVLELSNVFKCIDGYDRTYTSKTKHSDVNYGLYKYVINLDEDGNKI